MTQKYMDHKQLPPTLREMIDMHGQHILAQRKVIDPQHVFQMLPKFVKRQLGRHLHATSLSKVRSYHSHIVVSSLAFLPDITILSQQLL